MSDDKPIDEDQVRIDEQRVIGEKQTPETDSRHDAEQRKAASEFTKDDDKTAMRVHVHSPFHDYYNGLATSISAKSATGPFDILPKHHNFISLLVPCEIVIRTASEGERRIKISGGILHVKANQVIVFLDV